MMHKWPKLASLSQIACTLYTFSSVMYSLPLEDNLFKKNVSHSDSLLCANSFKTRLLFSNCIA